MEKIIVSFTSWTKRIQNAVYVFKNMNDQTLVPDLIVLNLAEEEFPNREKDLPNDLVSYVDSTSNCEIFWVQTNTKPYKKLIPSIERFPEDIIITVDDDITYPQEFVEEIVKEFRTWGGKHPITGGKYKWDGDIYSHHGAYTLTKREFFGEYVFDLYENLYLKDPDSFPFSDPMFTFAALLNGVEYKHMSGIDMDHIRKNCGQDEVSLSKKGTSEYRIVMDESLRRIKSYILATYGKTYEDLIKGLVSDQKVIVSLTSFSERLKFVPEVVQSILDGTMKPFKIVLSLDRKDLDSIPADLQDLIEDGVVELLVSDYLIKPHTKYFLVMQKYRDCAIITIDDDVVYTPDLVESLFRTYTTYHNCICARRCHRIKWNADDTLLPYMRWKWECKEFTEPRMDLIATGVGGVLYPPNILNINEDMLEDIRRCLNADDIYLKWLEMKNGIKTVWVPNDHVHGVKRIDEAQDIALFKTNCNQNQNDVYLEQFRLPHIPEPSAEKVSHTRRVIQPEISECSGNFTSPVVVFTCCFNGEIPEKQHEIENVKFICFTNDYRSFDGWETRYIDTFKSDPSWGARYIKFHPRQYVGDYSKVIYIDSNVVLPQSCNIEFKEPIAIQPGGPVWEEVSKLKGSKVLKGILYENGVNKLCMSKKDNFIIYNFKNPKTDKLLRDIWQRFNPREHIFIYVFEIPPFNKTEVKLIKPKISLKGSTK